MVYLGETKVFERHVAEFGYSGIGIHGSAADFVEQVEELIFIHCRQNNSGGITIEVDGFLETGPADTGHDPV
jgi:hypothetical protein